MSVVNWSCLDVKDWLTKEKISMDVISVVTYHELDGPCILSLNDRDFSENPINTLQLKDRKRLFLLVKSLQKQNQAAMIQLGLAEPTLKHFTSANVNFVGSNLSNLSYEVGRGVGDACREHTNNNDFEPEVQSRPASEDGRASRLKPEVWKAFLSLCYVFLVTWVTAVVMVIVHDKVPDMKKYPPLPDLFLDNVPHIPWAFDMCEITGSVLMAIWVTVLIFHKHRFILLRRFFALSGTVFLLRCITMLITSLSVPGGHLKCAPRSYPSEGEFSSWSRRLGQASAIWTGAGMSVRGVRTCGDYMFSGHTVALTLLNFFITEYTSRSLYLLHIVTWLMNMFGIFFILAAHEHYSIDVFIAFYITSRLFLYYHTLSNNQALMQGDSMRTRIWFPLLSFFESEVDGIVPNEYESPLVIFSVLKSWIYQMFHEISESSVAKMAGNSINQQAVMADFSVTRLVDNIKRNIINPGTDLRVRKNMALLSDKNVQASITNDGGLCQLKHCIGAMCTHDVMLTCSSDSTHLKDN